MALRGLLRLKRRAQPVGAVNKYAARAPAAATSSHPCAVGDKGLLRVTSSLWENNLFAGSAFPLTTSPWARLNCSISLSTSSTADIF